MEITPNEQFVTTNLNKIFSFIDKIITNDNGAMKKLFTDFSERFATAPASTRTDFYSAFPGGLCFHTLNIIHWINKFSTLMAPPDQQVSKQSLLTVSLLCEFGKIGDEKHDYYTPVTSDWHNDKGIYYEINHKISFMKPCHRALYFANNYNIVLTRDEFLAILLLDEDESSSYKYKEPHLATILKHSVGWARQMEKQNNINWPT